MLALAAILVGILGLSGGFGAAEPAGLTKLSAATGASNEVVAKPLTIRVGQPGIKDGQLMVPLSVTLEADQPMSSLDLASALRIQETDAAAKFTRPATPFPINVLNISPGVTTDIIATWPDSPGPKTLEINSLTWRVSSLDGSQQWFDPTPVAEVVLR